MKVHIFPTLDPEVDDPGNGGIHRVVLAQYQKLAELGWEIVATAAEADVIHCNVEVPPTYTRLHGDKPIIVTSHGLYWTDGGYEWDAWCYTTNQKAMHAIRVADAVVAVSEWVAQSIRRNTMRPVTVIRNGVEADDWLPAEPDMRGNYVLWNKTRVDPICDPQPMNDVAALLPRVQFVSTFGSPAQNVEITGRMPHADMAQLVRRAGVYLATTRETWGIGTLEAMAAGVPVVGYRWGGQREFIEQGVDGWLVRPGDVEGLAEGVEWAIANREAIAPRARAKAQQFTLEAAATEYANLYQQTYDRFTRERSGPKVSVIVPAYNMGEYLDDALRSVSAQTMGDWECVIVNDASPDPRDHEIAERWVEADKRFSYVNLASNGYLAHARNAGIEEARGRYIMPLDADDKLTPTALDVLSHALDQSRDMDIAYGGVLFVGPDGHRPMVYAEAKAKGYSDGHSGWPVTFRMDWMLRGPGQLLPYASMYRRRVWEYTGGYRERCRSSEDQDFWLRSTSYGFAAQMVTEADTLVYRVRPDSMSGVEGWEEHRGWYPWVRDRDLIPGGAIQEGKDVRHIPTPAYDPAPVAVVIPVGPGHEALLYDAIDSVDAQTFRAWECIVVNDTGHSLVNLPSWVRVIEQRADMTGEWVEPGALIRYGGAAAARNAGIAATSAPLFLPLDADDYLQPQAIEAMLDNYMGGDEPAVIYSDFWEDPTGEMQIYRTPDYDPYALIRRGALHAVTALTPRKFWAEVGGYNESVAWEDWAFALALAGKGHCSRRVARPLFTYRKSTGNRREMNMADFEESKRAIMQLDFGAVGGELLACSSCPAGRRTTGNLSDHQHTPRAMVAPSEDSVLVRYTGKKAGDVPFKSLVDPRVTYRFSLNRTEGYVHPQDAQRLLQYDDFEMAPARAAIAEADDDEPIVAARIPVGAQVHADAGPPSLEAQGLGIIMSQAEAAADAEARTAAPNWGVPEVALVSASEGAAVPTAVAAPPENTEPVTEAEEATAATPQARAYAERFTREQLNDEAAKLGLTGVQSLRTKAEAAASIIEYKKMFGLG